MPMQLSFLGYFLSEEVCDKIELDCNIQTRPLLSNSNFPLPMVNVPKASLLYILNLTLSLSKQINPSVSLVYSPLMEL